LLKKTEERVTKLFSESNMADDYYHNISHTHEVISAVKDIGNNAGLTEKELNLVVIASWFHDTGYIKGDDGHEELSAKYAEEFLLEKNVDRSFIDDVKNCILATKVPQQPKNLMEEVICDADLHHLGTDEFFIKNEFLRIEIEQKHKKKFLETEWLENSINFLSQHKFFTDYAEKKFGDQKRKNFLKLQKQLRKKLSKKQETKLKTEKLFVEKEKLKNKKKEINTAGRSIETMFRNVMRTHVEFSSMADSKANIMISVNTILLTAIIAILIRKLDTNTHLVIPTIIITIVSVVTLIFATLVTRPKITSGTFTNEDISQKRANLLFFGNFFNMKLKDFEWGMNQLIRDKEYLYSAMIKDFYYLGQVLGRKYRYLNYCYGIFIYGMIISVIAFTIAFVFFPEARDLGVIIE
ncbi:MAG: DUF5706 domain-containing protein, partial [Melioribacteraceae bacterium]|nr:DUF5706 domain-containing protein [Melioribacteraceae bacterium]